MGKSYAVIGAGRQGSAAAFDMIKFGGAEKIGFLDNDFDTCLRKTEKNYRFR
jgi:hypothetical protein